jgi:hypothetical protein
MCTIMPKNLPLIVGAFPEERSCILYLNLSYITIEDKKTKMQFVEAMK